MAEASQIAELIERLDAQSMPEPNSGCQLWLGTVPGGPLPYGALVINGRRFRAHRAAWIAHRGEIPAGMLVCHRCDNTLCINTDHLFLGTHLDNNRDRDNKRRDYWSRNPAEAATALKRARDKQTYASFVRGSRQHQAKTTEEAVRKIREAASKGEPQRSIASRFGLSQGTVSLIVNRKGWAHVA